MNQPQSQVPPPPVSAAPPQKKSKVWIWLLGGCLGLVLLVVVAVLAAGWFAVKKGKEIAAEFEDNPGKTFAEMAVRANPELDLVSTDDSAGTITVRNNKTGEVVTVDWSDIGEGKLGMTVDGEEVSIDASGWSEGGADGSGDAVLSVKSKDGEQSSVTFGSGSADQVPSWAMKYPGTQGKSQFHAATGQKVSGAFVMQTDDSVSQVLDYFADRLSDEGYQVSTQTYSTPDGDGGAITANSKDPTRSMTYLVSFNEGKTQIVASYSQDG